MGFIEIINNKRKYMELLLLADEQESMINKYLDRGRMFAVNDDGIKAVSVVTDEGNGILEIKNIAVYSEFRMQGYGKCLIKYLEKKFSGEYSVLQVGTGDSPLTVPFYERCGFKKSHIIKNFFIDNYDHAIFEAGKQLVDMVYFIKQLN